MADFARSDILHSTRQQQAVIYTRSRIQVANQKLINLEQPENCAAGQRPRGAHRFACFMQTESYVAQSTSHSSSLHGAYAVAHDLFPRDAVESDVLELGLVGKLKIQPAVFLPRRSSPSCRAKTERSFCRS